MMADLLNPSSAQQSSQNREEWIFQSRMAHTIERYDESSQCLRKVILLNTEVSVQERNLIRTAFKNAYDVRRNSWNILANLEKAEIEAAAAAAATSEETVMGKNKTLKRIRYYRIHLQKEMQLITADVFDLLDIYLLPNANSVDARVFFYMMKGDYHRYQAELIVGEARREAAISAMVCYKAAHRMGEVDLPTTHPVRLAVCVNYSVLLWRIFRTIERAVRMAKNGYDDAISVLHIADEEHIEDATRQMGVLRSLMTRWARKLPKGTKNIIASRMQTSI